MKKTKRTCLKLRCVSCSFNVDWYLPLVWRENTSLSLQTIGQAYDDMQTQNQHLLQQITERDDYNIKVKDLLNCSEESIYEVFQLCLKYLRPFS